MVSPVNVFPNDSNQYNLKKSVHDGKGSTPQPTNSLLKQIKPIIMALRAVFCMPLSWNAHEHTVKWRSWWLIYSLVGYTILTVAVATIFIAKLQLGSPTMSSGDMPYHYGSLLLMLFHFVPLFCIIEIKKIAKLFNGWKSAETKYLLITRKPPQIRLTVLMYCSFIFSAVSTISFGIYIKFIAESYYERRELKTPLKRLELPLIIYQQGLINLTGNLYFMLNIALQQFSTIMATDLKNIHQMNVKSIEKYAALWVELRDVATLIGDAFSYSGVSFMLCQFCINVASFYNFTINILYGQEIGSHFVISLFCLTLQIMVPESTHHTIDKIGPQFQNLLARSRTLVPSDTEVGKSLKYFHELTAFNPVIISLGGFIILNRGLTVSILGSYVTYVVIFLQMQPSTSCPSEIGTTITPFN